MNPFQLLQLIKNSKNPFSAVQQMAGNNPQIQQLLNNLQGKSPKELKQYAMNVAQSKGVDLGQYLGQFGLKI